jgi:uncharacterized protein (DUF952 family)
MEVILHIASREDWEKAKAQGSYRTDSLIDEGFIHCSKRDQVIEVANTFFRGQEGLVLLSIDRSRVAAEIRHENLEGGEERFPHIYGALNLDAVIEVIEFEPGEDGRFQFSEK